jgi:uncharacterized protein YlxP (DUF503 family)
MLLVNMQISLYFPYAVSLKGRRKIINSIKERLKKFNLSILDVSREYIKEGELAIAYLAFNQKSVEQIEQSIEKILDRFIGEIEYEISKEVL